MKQATYPGKKVQIDIKYVPRECICFGTNDQNYYQITAIDEYTRKRVLRIVDEKSTYQTTKFLETLEAELGFKIEKIQSSRYNNISRKVLNFKSPNEMLKEYRTNN